MATLELQGLTKRFGEFTAVDSMNLKAAEGEMIALLGGSGCGKTTILRMIAGFTEPTAGQILVDGKNVSTIPPYRRNIGIFFQNYALFPHMTVFENVAFGLKLQKLPKNEIRERVEHMLALVKLTGMDKRYPRQQQRGQFIAEAFSAARRHNAKRVASGKNGVDQRLLARTEFGKSEILPQRCKLVHTSASPSPFFYIISVPAAIDKSGSVPTRLPIEAIVKGNVGTSAR